MTLEERLAFVERRLAWTCRVLFAAAIAVPTVFLVVAAADLKFVDLVAGSVSIKNSKGKTVTELNPDGNVKVGNDLTVDGKFTVKGVDMADRLVKAETQLAALTNRYDGTVAASSKRYAGILERLEKVEREKNDMIEIITRSIESTNGRIVEIGGENVPQDNPGKVNFKFTRKHARYEVFVTDIDITYPGPGDHSEIQSMRLTAKVLEFKGPTDAVDIEYRLFVKSEPKRIPFKGTAKLIVIGY